MAQEIRSTVIFLASLFLLLGVGTAGAETVSTAEYVISGDPPKVNVHMCKIGNGIWFPSRADGYCHAVDEHASLTQMTQEQLGRLIVQVASTNPDSNKEIVFVGARSWIDKNDVSHRIATFSRDGWRWDKVSEDPDPRDLCIAKMEAALKALHPFSMLDLDPVHEQIGLDLVKKRSDWHYRAELPPEDLEGLTPYGLTQTLNARAGRAVVLWDTVKRECLTTK